MIGKDLESCLCFWRSFIDLRIKTPTHEIPLSSASLKWIGFESILPVFDNFDFQPASTIPQTLAPASIELASIDSP